MLKALKYWRRSTSIYPSIQYLPLATLQAIITKQLSPAGMSIACCFWLGLLEGGQGQSIIVYSWYMWNSWCLLSSDLNRNHKFWRLGNCLINPKISTILNVNGFNLLYPLSLMAHGSWLIPHWLPSILVHTPKNASVIYKRQCLRHWFRISHVSIKIDDGDDKFTKKTKIKDVH